MLDSVETHSERERPIQRTERLPASPGREISSLLASASTTLDLRNYLRIFWRRKAILFWVTLIFTALSIFAVMQIKPRYTSTALIMIDTTRRPNILDIEGVIAGLPNDLSAVQGEIEILKSRALATRAVGFLNLFEDPEFNVALRPQEDSMLVSVLPATWVEAVSDWRSQLNDLARSTLGGENEETDTALQTDVVDSADQARQATVSSFLRRLSVEPQGRSFVIAISFESESANKSALIANKIADLYLVDQLDTKFEATRRAVNWLHDRLDKLRIEVEDAENKVEQYRATNGLIGRSGDEQAADRDPVTQQITQLNTQLVLARAERAAALARLRQAQSLGASASGNNSTSQVLTSPLIQRLREQETTVLRKVAELSSTYGDRHPVMINAKEELKDLRSKIQEEVQRIVASLKNDLDVVASRENTLAANLKKLEREAATLNEAEIQLRELTRQASSSRSLYEEVLRRFKETSAQEDLQEPDARIISQADAPVSPSYPKRGAIVSVAALLSFGLAVLIILIVERLSSGFRSIHEIESRLGVEGLAMVPAIRTSRGKSVADHIVEKPLSAFSEAIRSLRTGLLISQGSNWSSKLVVVTSSVPHEGKTSISTSLARLAAQSGDKTILIDCDIRRPQVNVAMNLPNEVGLIDLLRGRKSLDDVCQKDERSDLTVITTGIAGPNDTDLVNSEKFIQLLRKLTINYEFVVVDTSPVMAVSDTRVIALAADYTVHVVRWGATPREVAMAGIKQLLEAGVNSVGVVMSRVNVSKHSQYGYGDAAHYYGRYGSYYSK